MRYVVLWGALFLFACGGDGSGDDPSPADSSAGDASTGDASSSRLENVEAYCERDYDCFPGDYLDENECVTIFDEARADAEAVSETCAQAFDGVLSCLATLTCAQLDRFYDEGSDEGPCREEEGRLDDICDS